MILGKEYEIRLNAIKFNELMNEIHIKCKINSLIDTKL